MQAITRILAVTVLFIGFIGCSSMDYVQGTKVSDDQVAQFNKGKTTKNEVILALGAPQDSKLEGGKQIMIYKYQKIGALSANEGFDTTFIFNGNGVLEDVLKSSGTSLPNPLTGQ